MCVIKSRKTIDMRSKENACSVLGLDKGENDKEKIKKAYHKLALKFHPDKGGDADKFREVSEAYKLLTEEKVSIEDDEDWENFDPINFFKEQFTQNDIFVMVQDAGLFDNVLDSNNIFGTLFSNLGGIMMDQNKIFHLAANFLGDDSNILFNTLKSTHDFAKDLGSKIKDVSVNVNAHLKDVYRGKVVRVNVKRRRFVDDNAVEDNKKCVITLKYQHFKLPHEGHQLSPISTACGDVIFHVKIKDHLDTVTRFCQDHIFVEAKVTRWQNELILPWANNISVDLAEWKKDTSLIILLSGYGFIKNELDERGDMYIHVVYDENAINEPKGKERADINNVEETALVTTRITYTLVSFKNIILLYTDKDEK